MSTKTQAVTVPADAIAEVPYAIGISEDALHAVDRDSVVQVADQLDGDGPLPQVSSECGVAVYIAQKWGEFRRDNGHLRAHRVCSRCAWVVALDQCRVDEELAALAPTAVEEAACRRRGVDAALLGRVCDAILDQRRQEKDDDADSPRWAQLLGHVCAHRPEVLVSEECTEGGCEHDDAGCLADTPVACPTCSVRAGGWAGEWEGRYEVTVPAPCSVLTTMAAQFVDEKPSTEETMINA